MGLVFMGTIFGLILGAGSGTEVGAFFGAVVGMSAGLVVYGLGWMRAHLGSAPTVETHRLICTPQGALADCELEGDLETGRWSDVKRCSLLHPAGDVSCEKSCLRLMNDSGVKPGAACHCEDEPAAAPLAS